MRERDGAPGGWRTATDAGFSLVEMVVALGIFSLLMVMTSIGLLRAMSGIRTVDSVTAQQIASSTTAESLGRYLRYMALPKSLTTGAGLNNSGVISASTKSLRFYSYSGSGQRHDIPYLVDISVQTLANGAQQVVVTTTPPNTVSNGQWTWGTGTTASTRRLLAVPAGAGTPLALGLTKCERASDCHGTRVPVSLGTTPAAVALSDGWVNDTVTITVGPSGNPDYVVTQTIALVNQI